jgi:ring-1,2-phenylacetyl-CoA epoxidase subunit PaaC
MSAGDRIAQQHAEPLFEYALRLADDVLVLGHRLSQWSGRGPMLEEDIALSNLALDLIGQARLFYAHAGEVEGKGRDEDRLAYFREAGEFRNVLLVEQPNGDFAATMVRHFLFAAFLHPYYQRLSASAEAQIAGIAAKASKELAYHLRHSSEWVIRLGDGTGESRRRAQAGLDELWTYTGELFEMDEVEQALLARGIAVDRAALLPVWQSNVSRVLSEATLERPADGYMQRGGRTGRHSESLGRMLAEMQVLARAHPDATW